MTTKKPHWTQTPEGKEKMSAIQKLAWKNTRSVKQQAVKTVKVKTTKLIINGWTVTLSKGEIRIEND